MEYAQDVDVPIGLDEVRDTVGAVQQDAHVLLGMKETVAHLRILREDLSALIDPFHRFRGSIGIISGDVLEDVLEPAKCFACPGYFGQDRMRRPISSFEMVRRASESARPR